jgi:hypothetical protein
MMARLCCTDACNSRRPYSCTVLVLQTHGMAPEPHKYCRTDAQQHSLTNKPAPSPCRQAALNQLSMGQTLP